MAVVLVAGENTWADQVTTYTMYGQAPMKNEYEAIRENDSGTYLVQQDQLDLGRMFVYCLRPCLICTSSEM